MSAFEKRSASYEDGVGPSRWFGFGSPASVENGAFPATATDPIPDELIRLKPPLSRLASAGLGRRDNVECPSINFRGRIPLGPHLGPEATVRCLLQNRSAQSVITVF